MTGHIARIGKPRWALVAVEVFVALGAWYGGVALMAGNALNIPDYWLSGTAFESWVTPGLLLIFIIALPMTVAAIAEVRRFRWAPVVSLLAGLALVGWIGAQWLLMQRFFVLQPVMLAAGLVVLALAADSLRVQGRTVGTRLSAGGVR